MRPPNWHPIVVAGLFGCAPTTPASGGAESPAAEAEPATDADPAAASTTDEAPAVFYGTRGYTWRGFEFWGWNCGERELEALLRPDAPIQDRRFATHLGKFEESDERVRLDHVVGQPAGNGTWTFTHDGGATWTRGKVEAGLPDGAWKFFHPNGKLCGEGNYEAGRRDGAWRWLHPNGELAAQGAFLAGEPSSEWVVRSSEQRYAAWNRHYAKGRPFTSYRGFPHGRPTPEVSTTEHDVWRGRFEAGRRVGPWKYWHPNGTLAREGNYADGFQVGEWRAWDDLGQLLEVSVWDGGRKTKVVELHEDRLGPFGRVKVRGKDVDVAFAAAESPEAALAAFLAYDEGAEDMLADPLILAGAAVVPVLLGAVANRDLELRRYAISALGDLRDGRALPVLVSIVHDASERDIFRGDALNAILQIDEWVGRDLAQRYADANPKPDYLGRTANRILAGEAWYRLAGRSYVEALLHRHH